MSASAVVQHCGNEQRRAVAGRNLPFRKPFDDPRHAIVQATSSDEDMRIAVGDLLAIDFTVDSIDYDSPYLVSFGDDHLYLRIFQRMPAADGRTGLFMKQRGDFELVGPRLLASMKVHGEVMNVYRRD